MQASIRAALSSLEILSLPKRVTSLQSRKSEALARLTNARKRKPVLLAQLADVLHCGEWQALKRTATWSDELRLVTIKALTEGCTRGAAPFSCRLLPLGALTKRATYRLQRVRGSLLRTSRNRNSQYCAAERARRLSLSPLRQAVRTELVRAGHRHSVGRTFKAKWAAAVHVVAKLGGGGCAHAVRRRTVLPMPIDGPDGEVGGKGPAASN
eukprot:CAMPEP_0119358828 /NCGR_PEP_ID=MMETSP1334-20130426/6904_1 /TAXON_ID=127549 /ORGANISM="Calcidiscus leptoporus, Strain RCC1130" /LENGTH=210 /DNA_ID=CAMNT_0007373387 /DNA_START=302 /DNA_END=934 /DNA_ORIENTATION=+